MITITESASVKIADIIAEENNPNMKLRMFVQGGGCSGFSYGFTLDEMKNEDDFEFDAGAASVLVDAMSAQYLQGAEFKIKNPSATSTCGCGSSFAV